MRARGFFSPMALGLLALLAIQILLGWHLRPYRPAIEQMPLPPSPPALKALAYLLFGL